MATGSPRSRPRTQEPRTSEPRNLRTSEPDNTPTSLVHEATSPPCESTPERAVFERNPRALVQGPQSRPDGPRGIQPANAASVDLRLENVHFGSCMKLTSHVSITLREAGPDVLACWRAGVLGLLGVRARKHRAVWGSTDRLCKDCDREMILFDGR
jgi:hypothetical protein